MAFHGTTLLPWHSTARFIDITPVHKITLIRLLSEVCKKSILRYQQMSASFSQWHILLVEDLPAMITFMCGCFDCIKVNSSDDRTMPFSSQTLESHDHLFIIIDESTCNEQVLAILTKCNVTKCISVTADDPTAAQRRAVEAGASMIDIGSREPNEGMILGGPEGLIIHISSRRIQAQKKKKNNKNVVLDILLPGLFEHAGLPLMSKRPHITVDGGHAPLEQHQDSPFETFDPIPEIPTVDVKIMTNKSRRGWTPCPPNSRIPVPFETDLFKGTMLLIVRTDPIDKIYEDFFDTKKVCYEVQVQGKFLRIPEGDIYVGAETAHKLELGILTKAMCRTVLKFTSSMVNDLHWSFGTDQKKAHFEMPHMVAPIHRSMDRIIITPEGQKPPKMGRPFSDLETEKERKKRVSSKEKMKVDLTSIYSFSVNTSNFNLSKWQICNIPMVGSVNMSSVAGDTTVSLVGYELDPEVVRKYPDSHPQDLLKFVFNTKITPIDPSHGGMVGSNPLSEHGDDDIDNDDEDEDGVSVGEDEEDGDDDGDDDGEGVLVDDDGEMDDDDDDDGDGEIVRAIGDYDHHRQEESGTQVKEIGHLGGTSAPTFMSRFRMGLKGRMAPRETEESSERGERGHLVGRVGNFFKRHNPLSSLEIMDVIESPDERAPDYMLDGYEDLQFCPATLEVPDPRREGRRRVVYLMLTKDSAKDTTDLSIAAFPRLRAYTEISAALSLAPLSRQPKNKKLVIKEKKRRQIAESYQAATEKASLSSDVTSSLSALLFTQNETDKLFLGNGSDVRKIHSKTGSLSSSSWEGRVAHATSRRSWSEEHLVLSETGLSLYIRQDIKRATLSIPISAILGVRPLTRFEAPTPCFRYFQVETFARVFYFMVYGGNQLTAWMEAFSIIRGKTESADGYGDALGNADSSHLSPIEPEDAYLARPSCWKLDKRRVLNYRRIIFRSPSGWDKLERSLSILREKEGVSFDDYSTLEIAPSYLLECNSLGPNGIVEALLGNVLELSAKDGVAGPRLWISFMDKLSYLQILLIADLPTTEKVALLLNLYHVMVLHGNLVFGPPLARSSWSHFFSSMSYIMSFDLLSAYELEHNVLRAALCRPSPHTYLAQFPGLALYQRDFRLNFCINNGSKSMPAVVPLYKANALDDQLDEATHRMLASSVKVDLNRRAVQLPLVCSWYLSDFASRHDSSALPADCLRVVVHYLTGDNKAALMQMLTDGGNISVRFDKFIYRCSSFGMMGV